MGVHRSIKHIGIHLHMLIIVLHWLEFQFPIQEYQEAFEQRMEAKLQQQQVSASDIATSFHDQVGV